MTTNQLNQIVVKRVGKKKRLYVWDSRKRKRVLTGEIKNKEFWKDCATRHLLKIYDAFGINRDVLSYLVMNGVGTIVVRYNGCLYETDVVTWLMGIRKNFSNGEQIFLPIKKMRSRLQEKLF